MKFEASDPKKGLTVAELQAAVKTLVAVVEATGKDINETPVKAWVNMKAGIKSLEV